MVVEVIATIAVTLAAVAGILGSIGIIWAKGVKPVFRGVRRVSEAVEKVLEYDERLTVIEQRSRQLENNGGSHMRDAIDRIERKVDNELVNIYKRLAACPINHAGTTLVIDTGKREQYGDR